MTASVVRARNLILEKKLITVVDGIAYLAPSESKPGKLHPLLLHEGRWRCGCEGGDAETPCYHRLAAQYLARTVKVQHDHERR